MERRNLDSQSAPRAKRVIAFVSLIVTVDLTAIAVYFRSSSPASFFIPRLFNGTCTYSTRGQSAHLASTPRTLNKSPPLFFLFISDIPHTFRFRFYFLYHCRLLHLKSAKFCVNCARRKTRKEDTRREGRNHAPACMRFFAVPFGHDPPRRACNSRCELRRVQTFAGLSPVRFIIILLIGEKTCLILTVFPLQPHTNVNTKGWI